MIATIDFETYSEASYVWNWSKAKWDGGGLADVGSWVYAEHPSTEVLCLYYDLNCEFGCRCWMPSMPNPTDLFDHLAIGGLIEAHHSFFEFCIWNQVCCKRYGWPQLPLEQTRCSASKCRAYSLPGSLEQAGAVVGADVQKDKEGKRLLRLFSIPQKPTKKNPFLRVLPADRPEEAQKLYEYCGTDVLSEMDLSRRVPDLTDSELLVWRMDQRINARGVHVDSEGVESCISIVEQALAKYNQELRQITGEAVQGATKIRALKEWLETWGIYTDSLDEEHIDGLLASSTLPAPCRRALEIRKINGSSSVKKPYAIRNMTAKDGRIHELFTYCGADRTGRFSGSGPQPQNLPNSGPAVYACPCGCVYGTHRKDCPCCGAVATEYTKWSWKHVGYALQVLNTRNLDTVEEVFGDAMPVVAGCLRGLFTPESGNDYICSDFSAIEAVVQAFLSGEQWRIDMFNTHGKNYEMAASKITGVPFAEIMAHAGYDINQPEWWKQPQIGPDHPSRKKIGKVSELACFAGDTLVLTDSGWKQITEVTEQDKLFDGVDFVKHGGVVYRGEKLTTKIGNVTVTPEHKFYTGGKSWATTEDLNRSTRLLKKALDTANLCFCEKFGKILAVSLGTNANVSDAEASMCTSLATSGWAKARHATPALKKNRLNPIRITAKRALTKRTDADCLTGFMQLRDGAQTQSIDNTPATAEGGLVYVKNGLMTLRNGFRTLLRWKAGTTQARPLIESIMTVDTSPEISGLYRTGNNRIVRGLLYGSSAMEKLYRLQSFVGSTPLGTREYPQSSENSAKGKHQSKLSRNKGDAGELTVPVYDILDCGPRSRFAIMTSHGPLIAHNSGYGGWINAWLRFGAGDFLNEEGIKASIIAWRQASPMIVEMWGGQHRGRFEEYYGLEGMAIMAILNPGSRYTYRDITYWCADNILHCLLPSGRVLHYHGVKLLHEERYGRQQYAISYMGRDSVTKRWIRQYTHGGKLFENVVQAVSRDILTNSMLNLEAAGYPIVLHVHDEAIAEVPKGFGSVEEFENIMGVMPDWCKDWPIHPSGGWRGGRYRK